MVKMFFACFIVVTIALVVFAIPIAIFARTPYEDRIRELREKQAELLAQQRKREQKLLDAYEKASEDPRLLELGEIAHPPLKSPDTQKDPFRRAQ